MLTAFVLLLLQNLEQSRCTVTQVCFNGTSISCNANGFAPSCDIGNGYVRCEWLDAQGQKMVDAKYCSASR